MTAAEFPTAVPADRPVFAAHLAEVEDLGWAEVVERMELWARAGYEGNWQDPEYDLPEDWSWPDFARWLS